MICMFFSNNPSSGDINSSNLPCFCFSFSVVMGSTVLQQPYFFRPLRKVSNICSMIPKVCILITISGNYFHVRPGRVAQSVRCLATDASLTADPGVRSSIPARSHTFVEIDHEIISMVILLPSAESLKKGCCQLQAKVCAQSTGSLFV